MKILYFWCDKYLDLKNYNCNLAGEVEFLYDREFKRLIGVSKNSESKDFFNLLDESKELVPIEISAVAGKNGVGKTTTLQIIYEILSNRGLVISKDYKINYILIYEINDKKYITFEKGYVNEIIINNEKILQDNSEKETSEYNIEILSLPNNKISEEQSEITLEFPALNSIATLFYANTYEKTCDQYIESKNSINLSNHYLLNRFLKGDSDLFKDIDFKEKKLEPLDFWQMEMLSWDIELMCSEKYEELIKEVNLVSPKYFNIVLDYACDIYETKNIFSMNLKRSNNTFIEKFSFEEFMENSNKNNFFDYVNQRICELVAELILSEKFIDKDKIIKLINGFKDFNECSSIIELLDIIVTNLRNKECIYIIAKSKNGKRLMEKQNEIIYYRIEEIILAAYNMISKLSEIKKSCIFEEELIKIDYNKDNYIGITDNVPMLTKEINRKNLNKEIFKFIRELAATQLEFYSITKVVPFYIEARGISSGQKSYLSIFAKLLKFSNIIRDKKEVENIVILFDELDTFLHPEWKRQLVYLLTKLLKKLFGKDRYKGIHIIMTTNQPYILSDIPKNNTILLSGNKVNNEVDIKKYSQYKTLGANIIDLLDDAFFLSEGNKGSYITEVIKNISSDLNNKEMDKEKIRTYMEIVKLIEEPLIQKSLIQKLSSKLEKNDKEKMIDYYEQLIKNLKAGE